MSQFSQNGSIKKEWAQGKQSLEKQNVKLVLKVFQESNAATLRCLVPSTWKVKCTLLFQVLRNIYTLHCFNKHLYYLALFML